MPIVPPNRPRVCCKLLTIALQFKISILIKFPCDLTRVQARRCLNYNVSPGQKVRKALLTLIALNQQGVSSARCAK